MIVCQAIIIAMTVVLPAPVASFSARRSSSGLASALAFRMCSQNFVRARPFSGATSVSQIAVSTASIWQKNGLTPWKPSVRQCFRRRAVSGVTSHCSGLRQVAPRLDVGPDFVDDRRRIVFLLLEERSSPASKAIAVWLRRLAPLLGFGNRRDELGSTTRFQDAVGRLAVGVQLPMPTRIA